MSKTSKTTLEFYTTGFILSFVLTIGAYLAVVQHLLSGRALLMAITALAVTQLMVQLVFFLHLGREPKPRLNMVVFLFMLLVLVILVFGSLWIMNNLTYQHTHLSPTDTNRYLINDEGFKK